MMKLEHFGWVRVVDTPCPDGSVMVSYVRDDEEKAQQADNEYKYRCAKLASEFAESASERLTQLQGADKAKKKGVATIIICSILALIFVAAAALLFVWDGFYKIIFTDPIALNGWTFIGDSSIGSVGVEAKLRTIIFLCVACGAFVVFFLSLIFSGMRKNKEKKVDNLDYAQFAFAETTYYDEVKEKATAEANFLFPYGK